MRARARTPVPSAPVPHAHTHTEPRCSGAANRQIFSSLIILPFPSQSRYGSVCAPLNSCQLFSIVGVVVVVSQLLRICYSCSIYSVKMLLILPWLLGAQSASYFHQTDAAVQPDWLYRLIIIVLKGDFMVLIAFTSHFTARHTQSIARNVSWLMIIINNFPCGYSWKSAINYDHFSSSFVVACARMWPRGSTTQNNGQSHERATESLIPNGLRCKTNEVGLRRKVVRANAREAERLSHKVASRYINPNESVWQSPNKCNKIHWIQTSDDDERQCQRTASIRPKAMALLNAGT